MAQVLELPSGNEKCPAVVIVHEWWGVNEQMQAIAKRYAEEGFLALVPDLYDGKVIPIGDAAAANAAMSALDFGKAVQQIAEAVETLRAHPRCNGKVAITGYCMGGALTLASAVNIRGLACAVPFYGLPGDLDWSKVDVPIQAHFAQHDEWATVAGAQKVKDAVNVPMELHVYDAQHAFCNEKRPEVYHPEHAKTAWDRALAFIRQHTA
jgi:carboxymethylenebutenolidase